MRDWLLGFFTGVAAFYILLRWARQESKHGRG